jgi:hypothetical protein
MVMKQELLEAPRRIMRVSRPVKQKEVATNALDAKLKSIAQRTAMIEKLAAENEAAQAELTELLSAAGMQGYTDGEWEANIVNKMTKASRVPDTGFLYKKMSLADFLSVVKVSVTELKAHMTDREIDQISEITPAIVTGQELKVQRVKRKVKKG